VAQSGEKPHMQYERPMIVERQPVAELQVIIKSDTAG
jgi:hypothetical protein